MRRSRLKTISGDIRVTGVQGELWVESVSGDVTANGVGRLATAKSVSGDINISRASSSGDVTLSTVSGSLLANRSPRTEHRGRYGERRPDVHRMLQATAVACTASAEKSTSPAPSPGTAGTS